MLRSNKKWFAIIVAVTVCLSVSGSVRAGTVWLERQKLLASDGATLDYFGRSVSISGDYAIVGACYDDDNGDYSGSAYIFKCDGSGWVQQQKLLASDGAAKDLFGCSVSISGDFAIVGAHKGDGSVTDSGSAYIFAPASYPVSDPMTGSVTQAGSGLDETDPNKMVEIANGDVCIKFVPIVSGGGSVTITELSCQTIEGDGVIIVENIRGIRAITALDNGDYLSTLKVFYEEQDLPEGWTERDLRIAQLQGVLTMPRWVAELMLYMLPEPHYGPPTFDVGDWGVDEEGNYVWANVDHFSDYAVGVKLVTGDYDGNRNVDFRDFSHFVLNWQDVNCPDFEWCNGTDLDFSTVVDFNDLQIFVSNWLYDANDPNTW